MKHNNKIAAPIWFDAVPDRRRYDPLTVDVDADITIIGGGIVGLLTAWKLRKSGQRIILLEKNHLGSGDSGATTAFLSRVPDADFFQLQKQVGQKVVEQICNAAAQAQKALFELISSEHIVCDWTLLSSFFGAYEKGDAELKSTWSVVSQLNMDATRVETKPRPEFPFEEAVEFHNEGTFHIRKFLLGVAERLGSASKIYEESEVLSIEEGNRITLHTPHGKVNTKKVVLAVGDPSVLFPEMAMLLNGSVTYVINAAIQHGLPPALYWDTHHPYFYFRPLDLDHLMVGGADAAFGKTDAAAAFKTLEAFALAHWKKELEVTHAWSGSIFHTTDGLPYVFQPSRLQGRVWIATGFAGNGLVFGPLAADVCASQILQRPHPLTELFSLARTGAKLERSPKTILPSKAKSDGWFPVGKASDFPEGKLVCKTVEGKEVLVCRVRGTLRAMNNRCTHAGGRLCDGMLEGTVVECPLHAGRFDLTNGNVVAPPPIRPEPTYATRVQNGNVEIHLSAQVADRADQASSSTAEENAKEPERHWRSLFRFLPIPIVLWLIEFFVQYRWLSANDLGFSFVRSFALAGTTLIASALLTSTIFKWNPKLARHWRVRRYLGVSGFVLIFLHVLSVFHFLFDYQLDAIFFSFHPIDNPIIFGSIAFIILFLMAATSIDWAMQKLSPKRWKALHRCVYLAEIGIVFHFLTINPLLLKEAPTIALMVVMGLAILGQLYWWIRISAKRRFRNKGAMVGAALILLAILLAILEIRFFQK